MRAMRRILPANHAARNASRSDAGRADERKYLVGTARCFSTGSRPLVTERRRPPGTLSSIRVYSRHSRASLLPLEFGAWPLVFPPPAAVDRALRRAIECGRGEFLPPTYATPATL